MAGVFSGSLRFSNTQATTLMMFNFFNLIDASEPHNDPDHVHPSTISSGLNSLAAIGLRDFLPSNTRAKMGDSWQVLLYPGTQTIMTVVVTVLTPGVGDKADGSWVRMRGIRPHLRNQGDAFHA